MVSAAVSAGTRRVYGSYWNRILTHWGQRRLDEPTPTDIEQLAEHVRTHTVTRRNACGGRSAAEHLIAALRCLYNRAVADGHLAEINHVAATTGNDPALDSLLLRLHTETACRRGGGALALRPADLDPDQCLILLREKAEPCDGSRSPPP